MAIVYDYRCEPCDMEWSLLSKRLSLGPTQWSHTEYTCFTCQTFLTIAACVDRNSWNVWLRNNCKAVAANPFLLSLAKEVDHRLASAKGFTPIELKFQNIKCPTCRDDEMLEEPFGEHLMRCPNCRQYTGEYLY